MHERVIHINAWQPGDVYIGRRMPGWTASLFANPFKLKEHGKRCLVLFVDYLVTDKKLQVAAKNLLPGKRLACWCAPGPCHGDILARFVDGDSLADIRQDILALVEGSKPQQAQLFEAEPQPEPRKLARREHPVTSHQAAHAVVDQLPNLQAKVAGLVGSHPGSTGYELAVEAGVRDVQTVRRRLNEVEKLGVIRRGPPKQCKHTGRQAATWWPA